MRSRYVPTFDVISIGSVVHDLYVRAPRVQTIPMASSESGRALALPLGAKLEVDLMQHEVGGGAANSSVCFSRVGLTAGLISRVGDDFAGRLIREELQHENVDDTYLRIDKQYETAQSVLLLSPEGERTILVKRGAAADFNVNDVDESILRRPRWMYVSSIGGNMHVLQHIFRACRVNNIRIAWNPGALELAQGLDTLAPLLGETDVLVLNREEAAQLTAIADGSIGDLVRSLSRAVAKGVVVVTNGADGAAASDGMHAVHLCCREVPVVDATGAGDSFGSSFVAARIYGLAMDDALVFAMINSESVISHIGAQAGLLRKADMMHLGVVDTFARMAI